MLTNSTTTTLITATQQKTRKEITKFIAQNFKKNYQKILHKAPDSEI